MKLRSIRRTGQLWLTAVFCLAAIVAIAAPAGDLKFRALLVWATNAESSPNRNHKPVDGEVRKKLSELPLKWKNYFVVTNVPVVVARGGSQTATLSERCKIDVKDIDGRHFEVSLIGNGEPVLKRVQPLSVDKMLVLGGNAPNETGWLVVLRRVE